jgi:hypothetical protein
MGLLAVAKVAAVLVLFAHYADGQVKGVFSQSSTAQTLAQKALTAPSTLKAAYYAGRIVELLGGTSAVKCACDKLSALLAKETHPVEVFYGLTAATACKCGDVKISEKQKTEIKRGLGVSSMRVGFPPHF